MPLQFTISAEIQASRQELYNAWLNGKQHAAMTGVPATGSAKPGDSFTAHGDYISGRNIELIPFSKIVQSWRTTEFKENEEDSLIEIRLEEKDDKTLLTLTHSNLPPHGIRYEEGWKNHYFKQMKEYFAGVK